ncbi:MAG: AtpZ/AtpI family protein [Caldisericia bacterium]
MKWSEIGREFLKARMTGVSALLVIIMPLAIAGVGGFFLDKWLHTMPLFTILLSMLGLAASVKGALKFKP